MYRKQLALIILFFLIKFSFGCVHAADFYQTCLLPSSIDSNKDTIVLTPLNSQCQRICKKECDAFSRQFNPYILLDSESEYAKNGSQELNEDVILDCYAQCQKGVDQTKCSTGVEKAAGCQFKSQYFQAFQASCDDEKNQDIFYKVCMQKNASGKYILASGCTDSLACNPGNTIGYISFYKVLQPEAQVGMMCPSDQDNSYSAVQTTYTANVGDKFNLSLAGGASQNQLFLCGRKHLSVVPIFNNTSVVNNNDWFQFNWKNKNSHRYLATLDVNTFSTLATLAGAQAHWNKILADTTLSSLAAGWGARNPNFFDTGINLQKGDMISITWTGDYSYKGTGFSVVKSDKNGSSSLNIPYPDRQQLALQCLWNNNVSDKSACQTIWYNNSHLKMKDPGSGGNLQLLGEEFRVGGVESFGVLSSNKDPKSKIAQDSGVNTLYSLGGQVTDLDLIQSYVPGSITYTDVKGAGVSVDCSCDPNQTSVSSGGNSQNGCQNRFSNYNCINSSTFEAGKGQYTLGGTLQSDQFKSRGKFELMHFDDDGGPPDWYSDNTGGYSLEIDWSGCPKSNGENIQYTIALKDSKPDNDAKWLDITKDDLQKGNFTVAQGAFATGCQPSADGCVVFLRIKLESPDSGVAAGLADSYQYYNTFGQYNISFSKQGGSGGSSSMCAEKGFIYDTIKGIRDTLVGTQDPTKYNMQLNTEQTAGQRELAIGAVGVIFSGFIKQSANLVKLLVVLAAIFAAISYMIGLVDYTGDAFIKLVLKFAVVLALLTEHSWEFFGGYLVPFFIDGSVELVARYSAESMVFMGEASCKDAILKDPYMFFSLFDGPMSEFTSLDTWKRIWAICTSGLLGFFTAILIIMAIGYYFLAIVKVTAMFMFSIIMCSLLIVMAPVFIPLVLFKESKSIFDAWVKNLLSYALQPLFVYTIIMLLNFIVLMLIYHIFNFTACSVCLLKIDLGPLYSECWIPGYQNMIALHSPPTSDPSQYSAFASYAMSFIGAFTIYLVASGMSKFASVMAQMASWIVTGAQQRTTDVGSTTDNTSAYVQAQAQKATKAVLGGAEIGGDSQDKKAR